MIHVFLELFIRITNRSNKPNASDPFYIFLEFLNISFDFIESSIDNHDLPNVLDAQKIRKLDPPSPDWVANWIGRRPDRSGGRA